MKFIKKTLLNYVKLSFLYENLKAKKIVFFFFAGMSIQDIVNRVFDKECT